MSWEDLFDAAREKDHSLVRRALNDDPTRVFSRGPCGVTLLHVAAENDDVELATLLLDGGAEIEAEAQWGHTALEWAANMDSPAVAELLLARGARRHGLWTGAALGMFEVVADAFDGAALRPGVGRSPRPNTVLEGWPRNGAFRTGDVVSDAFYIACRNGRTEVAEFLLDRGADIDAMGYFGGCGVHWAAMNGHRDTVEFLVSRGADLSRVDQEFGGTPAGWAAEGGHAELASWLEERAE